MKPMHSGLIYTGGIYEWHMPPGVRVPNGDVFIYLLVICQTIVRKRRNP
jgi:hypothetical protein